MKTIFSTIFLLLLTACSNDTTVNYIIPETTIDIRLSNAYIALESNRDITFDALGIDPNEWAVTFHVKDINNEFISVNNFTEAQTAVFQSITGWPAPLTLSYTKETFLYYEFVFTSNTVAPVHARVFKADVLDTYAVNINEEEGYYGTALIDNSEETFIFIVNYLSNFRQYNNSGNGIVGVYYDELYNTYTIRLSSFEYIVPDKCLLVTVKDFNYNMNYVSGRMYVTTDIIDEFYAMIHSNGSISLCE